MFHYEFSSEFMMVILISCAVYMIRTAGETEDEEENQLKLVTTTVKKRHDVRMLMTIELRDAHIKGNYLAGTYVYHVIIIE